MVAVWWTKCLPLDLSRVNVPADIHGSRAGGLQLTARDRVSGHACVCFYKSM